jgi:regulator of cell morphogenesis and NO signaling
VIEEAFMSLYARRTVAELVLENPGLIPAFETLGIDYCCGGSHSLEDACREAEVSLDQVERSVAEGRAVPAEAEPGRDWASASLSELADHIVDRHHGYTRLALARLEELLVEVSAAHAERHPELGQMQRVFRGLDQELLQHMNKEESILFPYVAKLEEALRRRQPVAPAPFGTVNYPVRMMMQEHESAAAALREIRKWSSDYHLPADACTRWMLLYQGFQELEQDLHQHIHLENNILFPRALVLEKRAA